MKSQNQSQEQAPLEKYPHERFLALKNIQKSELPADILEVLEDFEKDYESSDYTSEGDIDPELLGPSKDILAIIKDFYDDESDAIASAVEEESLKIDPMSKCGGCSRNFILIQIWNWSVAERIKAIVSPEELEAYGFTDLLFGTRLHTKGFRLIPIRERGDKGKITHYELIPKDVELVKTREKVQKDKKAYAQNQEQEQEQD